MADGTSEETVLSAVPAFERFLFPEDAPASDENTPETREQPTATDEVVDPPTDAEASTEQADAEGDSDDTGHEDTPATESETELPPLDLTRKVKQVIDGKEVEISLEEALKGYSRTADYTRKTQEVAAQRKAFEAEQTAVRAERQKYAHLLVQLEQSVQSGLGQEPDWAQLQQQLKPEEFAAEYARWGIRQQELARITAERQKAMAAVERDRQAQLDAHLDAEEAKLFEAIPEWKDAKVADAEKAQLAAYATNAFGWTADDLQSVTDHRNIVLLRKAMLYDAAQAKRPDVRAKIEKVKAATPGPASSPKAPVSAVTKARQRLAKTGDVRDFAAALEALDES